MKFTFIILFLFAVGQVLSQSGTVTGRVVDKANRGFQDVLVFIEEDLKNRTRTDIDGNYELTVPADQNLTLKISYGKEQHTFPIRLNDGETYAMNKVRLSVQNVDGVNINATRKENIDNLPIIEIQNIPGPQNSVERYLTLTTAATSNNELTNNYNVRGGSYDENLVYVNGFLIYRPFLTRTGQQEGMSFINPNLVSNIAFSAGGFAAEYGDRLSSVLDITYRTPTKFRGSFDISLLGAGAHVEDRVSPRFNYMVAGRYQDQSYVLNSLPVQGAYQPRFYDLQAITNFSITENLVWSVLGHFSSNDFRFAPESQETNFGTINQALSFRVFFQGEEATKFQSMTGATSLKWDVNRRTDLNLYASVFNSDEQENFDILGQYFINELETDPAKEEFGDSVGTLGVGTFLNHARNRLFATIYQLRHEGSHKFLTVTEDGLDYDQKGELKWGASAQYETFDDVMSEWRLIDSTGYSIPQQPSDKIELFEVVKAENQLKTFRTSAFVQYNRSFDKYIDTFPIKVKRRYKDSLGNRQQELINDTIYDSRSRFSFNAGLRGGYTAFNNEFFATPRAGISYFPRKYYADAKGTIKKRLMRLHASAGTYYQPPFYRELRELNGPMNLDVLSQKSFHLVTGLDYAFEMWDRKQPFKFTGELFYKYMWDVNPYQIDNVRTRYFANNDAVADAYGMDMNVHGEFIPGIESFFKMGVMRTQENLLNDSYYEYFNSDGEVIVPGFTFNNVPVDSNLIEPGNIPRPTDQWFTFAMLFQDRMPSLEQFTVQLGLNFGSRLPYGPPNGNRASDTLRQKSYFRVDIGFGYDFLYQKREKEQRPKWLRPFNDVRLNFEIFNLLGIKNVLSQQWVQDTQGRQFAIPNYLTFRRYNLKLILRW